MPPRSNFQKLKDISKKNLELKKIRGSSDTFIPPKTNRKYLYKYNSISNI